LNLAFFAADGPGGEKTEQPTTKRKDKARKEGQVAKSPEIGTAAALIAVFFGLRIFAPFMLSRMLGIFTYSFTIAGSIDQMFNLKFASSIIAYLFGQALLTTAPILAIAFVIGMIANFLQVGWKPTTKPLRPKFNRFNPLKGVKRLFSVRQLVNVLKSILKLTIIVLAIYTIVKNELHMIPTLASLTVMQSVAYLGGMIINIGLDIGMLFIFVAVGDYAYNRYKHNKDMKMTKQEVKDEYKQLEGDPQIKGQIRRKMMQASMRRMMREVPSADVIITNPTHYAVAVKYDKEVSPAPRVIAKGVDFLAKRIKDEAMANGVEIVENRQLARTLYATVDIGREIPAELYQAVAEILAFVYKLKNKVS